jgi:hypothetical protein
MRACPAGFVHGLPLWPVRRSRLSLYAHITSVSWRLDTPTAVAGTVSDRSRADVRPFSFDASKLGKYELVNRLWEML